VGTTKNDEGRVFPFDVLPALKALLTRQRDYTSTVERRLGQIIPHVFHRDGQPICDFHKTWDAACERAATVEEHGLRRVVRPALVARTVVDPLTGKSKTVRPLRHDFRRTAVRNLERAGVSRSVAMKLTGHKTESVYRRYAIVAEQDLREGVAKLARLHGGTIGGQSASGGA
jgi:integrase